ncbi:hypothetical protein BN1708_009604 [Verticillium longisporum]|uniref:Uncharacterized protein n=1 Tax=Verticillium longisporum TaxID=100787 RepID=A0A0G4KJ00_VERLO|nr:hypothetical protein BN1708_009604 [Verticillium longisporum]
MPPTASRAVQGLTVQATCLGLCFQARLHRTKHLIHTNGEKVQPSLARGLYDGTSSTAPERNLTGTTRDTPRKIPRRCNRIQQRPGKQPAFKLSTGSIVAWPRHCICMRYYQHACQAIETWLTPSRQGPTKASSSEVAAAAAGVSAHIDHSDPRRLICMRRHHVSSPSSSSFVVVVVFVLVVKTGGLIRASMQPSTVLPPMALSLSSNVWALDWPSSGAQPLSMLTSFGLNSCFGPFRHPTRPTFRAGNLQLARLFSSCRGDTTGGGFSIDQKAAIWARVIQFRRTNAEDDCQPSSSTTTRSAIQKRSSMQDLVDGKCPDLTAEAERIRNQPVNGATAPLALGAWGWCLPWLVSAMVLAP